MISNNTVLVLGAGASQPYRLPLGRELTDRVCAWHSATARPEVVQLFEGCGVSTTEVASFARKLLGSRLKSVDAFIEKRPHLEEYGKLVMAYELCICESADHIVNIGIPDDWYAHVWERMHARCTSMDALANNHIRFITFNYDRSLEYFLFRAIKDTYGMADSAVLEFIPNIQILHLYGQLGALTVVPARDAREYSAQLTPTTLRTAANGIRIIPEARSASDEPFEKAKQWFEWANHIGFLGFGFDETNCARLELDAVLESCRQRGLPGKQIFATAYKNTIVETDAAKLQVCASFPWTALNATCLEFLREKKLL